MEVKITPDKNGQKIYTILWPNTQLDFLLADRDSAINYDKEAVYILMDKFRRCFYIGQTGGTKGGGISNRFKTHKWEKGFWDCALVIRDQHGDFGKDSIRAWFEWKLNDIAKSANTSVVLSSAGKQDDPYGVEERLNAILAVCRLIGISWAFQGDAHKAIVPPSKKSVKSNSSAKPVTMLQAESWKGKTQLAKLIARRGGNEGAFGGILQFFAEVGSKVRKPCRPGTKWRKPLEEAGVKFDHTDFVVDWEHAKNPL
jgi:hypothetical protein